MLPRRYVENISRFDTCLRCIDSRLMKQATRRSGWALVVAAAAACSGPAPVSKPAAPRDPLDDARAAERGHGVPRDYALAARIYDRACDGGRGNRTACRRLLHALLEGRGVDLDKMRAANIATVLCERTSDRLGCVIAALSVKNSMSFTKMLPNFDSSPLAM